ncbi:glycosyltransferase family 2 protein [Flavobacterium maritimum]|uniref:glycosyltransferase family 2 protein n=1 Tax=Flavobacterium maritimum TaxID=3149042 RepID=UPI0032B41642
MDNSLKKKPLVSITIPCRNEVNHISGLLESILRSDYNKDLIEIFIVDGMSDDGTIELLNEKYLSKYGNIKIIENTKQKTPYAFNLGIKESLGEIVVVLGARHIISSNYITEVVEVLTKKKEIGCVGGIVNNVYENRTSEIISKSMASPFGIGFNNFRAISKDTYVDTIGSPAFRKFIFDELGYFDEDLTRNQDDDFSFRLNKAGYKILLKANISIQYSVRSSFSKLFKQYKQYGYWKVFVNKKHKTVTTLRQLFPLLFLLSFPLFTIFILINIKFIYVFLLEIFSYLLLNFIFALKANGFNLNCIFKQMYTCFILHFSYGLGYLEGILDFLILNKKPNKKNETLSR